MSNAKFVGAGPVWSNVADVVQGPWKDPDTNLPVKDPGPRRHLRIPQLVPWRGSPSQRAVCGETKRLVDLFDEVTCTRCRDRFYIVRMAMESPATALEELMRRERDKHQLSVELTALGMLVDNHRDEFDSLVQLAATARGDND